MFLPFWSCLLFWSPAPEDPRPTSHICIFSCDLRSPACTFSITPFLPAPDSDLPDLPYLFVRESLMNVSASVPTAAFAARALVFQG